MMPQYHPGKPHHMPFPRPDGIVDNFYRLLSQLTINSKPLITELSILAQQNPTYASAFVSAIEERIFNAPPPEKLPSLYVLDSIVKNVGGEFVTLFSHNLLQLFLDAFNQVDHQTRGRFLRVLETWKEGGYFPYELLASIDSHIQKPHFPHTQQPGNFQPNRSPGHHRRPTHQQHHNQHPYQRPHPHPQGHFDNQLHPKPRFPQTKRPPPQQQMINGNQYSSPSPHPSRPAPVPAPALPTLPKLDASLIQTLLSSTSKSPQHPNSATSQSGSTSHTNLQRNSSTHGASPIPSNSGSTPTPSSAQGSVTSTSVTVVVTLNQKDILASRPNAYKVLYDHMPIKCGQCGIRFPPSEDIEIKQKEHLDWHFRQNRQNKTKKSSSRTWFTSESDWIQSKESELSSQQVPLFFNNDTTVDDETAKDEEEHHVLVPPNHADPYCPICKDKFQSVWSDAQEDWVYKNTVIIDDTIYHVNCYKDSTKFEGKNVSNRDSNSPTPGTTTTATE